MGKSRKPQTQTTTNEPWAPQQPHLQNIFGAAQNLYNQGPHQFFPGQTYADFNPWQTQALSGIASRAMQGNPLLGTAQDAAGRYLGSDPQMMPGLQGYLSGMFGSGGPSLGDLSQFAGVGNPFSGGFNPSSGYGAMHTSTGGGGGGSIMGNDTGPPIPGIGNSANLAGVGGTFRLQDMLNMFNNSVTGLPQDTVDALSATARGESLNGNPYLDATFNRAARNVTERFNQDVMPNIAAQFSMAGRTGSGMNALAQGEAAGEAADALSGLSNSIYGGNYQRERDRQLAAAGQLGGLSQAQQGLGLQALGMGTDAFNTNQAQDIQRRSLASQDELARLGLVSDNYNQAGNRAVQDRASRRSASASRYGALQSSLASRYGSDVQRYLGELNNDLGRRELAGNLFGTLSGQQSAERQNAANLGGRIYDSQLGNQFNWGQLAQSLAQGDYNDLDRLLQAGGIMQGQDQRGIDEAVNRWNFDQNAPNDALMRYLAAISGNYGGTSTTTTSGGGSGSGLLGGLLTLGSMFIPGGGGLFSGLFGGGGAAAGAGGGGTAGLFGMI